MKMDETELLRKVLAQAVRKRDELRMELSAKIEKIKRQYEPRLVEQDVYIRKLQEEIGERPTKGRVLAEKPDMTTGSEPTTESEMQADLLPKEKAKMLIRSALLPKVLEEALRRLGQPAKATEILKQIHSMGKDVTPSNRFAALKRALEKHPDKFLMVAGKRWALREWKLSSETEGIEDAG